jgi:hypothetical protein
LFIIFLRRINPGYGKTFTDTYTGSQETARTFYENDDPEAKMELIAVTEIYWKDIRDVVKDYINDNIDVWENEKPLWWSDSFISKIPHDMLPEWKEREMKEKDNANKRRVSFSLVQSVKESVIELDG